MACQAAASALRLELPPVRLDAEIVEALQDAGDGVGLERPVLAGDDLDQQLAADAPRGVVEAQQVALLSLLQLRRIVGMVEAQAFDGVPDRPFDELARRAQPPPSKSSGREPGSSTGRPIQNGWSAARNSASRP